MSFSSSTSQSSLWLRGQRLRLIGEVARACRCCWADCRGPWRGSCPAASAAPRSTRCCLGRACSCRSGPARASGERLAVVLLALELVEAIGGIGRNRRAVQQRPRRGRGSFTLTSARYSVASDCAAVGQRAHRGADRLAVLLGAEIGLPCRGPTSSTRSAAIPGTSCSSSVVPRRPSRSPCARMRDRCPLDARSMALAASLSSPALEHARHDATALDCGPGSAAFVLNSTSLSCFRESIEMA